MKSDWSKWFIADLKKLKRDSRRIIRHRSTDALTPAQKEDLYNTCQEAVDVLEETKHKIQSHR